MERAFIGHPPSADLALASWVIPVLELVYGAKIPSWCALPYPGHKHGCPNYGQRPGKCPPQAPFITELLDFHRPIYMVHSEFDLAGHVANMKARHPMWTDRQCRCVLYWQNRSRKQMLERVQGFVMETGMDRVVALPEAAGVHMYATALASGLKLEKIRSITTCRHISLVGWGL
jgi:hypothetical protein